MVQQKQTIVDARKKVKVTYEYRSFLGLFRHWREVRCDTVDDDLHIFILDPKQYHDIYINGVAITTLLTNHK